MIRVAVDGMGGDYAPQLIVEGAVRAANDFDLGTIAKTHFQKSPTELCITAH